MEFLLRSLAYAKSFLVTQITDDHWADFYSRRYGTSTDWVTGYVGLYLGDTFTGEMRARVCQWLLNRQKSGLWGWGYDTVPFPSDADSTAMCALFLNAQGYLSEANKQQIIDGLFDHQQPTGGFATFRNAELFAPINPAPEDISFSGWCMVHGSVTASVLQCLVALGVSPQESRLERAFKYLEDQQTGLWRDYWWRDPYYPTYEALAALRLRSYRTYPEVTRAIIAEQNPAGSWDCDGVESGFSTGMAIKALLLSGGNAQENIRRGIKRLLDSQLPDGSWAGRPILQVPAPTDTRVDGEQKIKIQADRNRVFSTVTIFSALLEATRHTKVRAEATTVRRRGFLYPAAAVDKPMPRLPLG